MPRPRRDSEILPAKDRLENAFWELLSEREYNKITVTDNFHFLFEKETVDVLS